MNRAMILLLSSIMLALIFISGCAKKEEPLVNNQTSQASQPVFSAEPSCPRGVTNDPAPGACFQYDDKNADGLCDLGE